MATIQKRGQYWRVQIRKKQYPPQSRTFDTKLQAEAWARAIESEMDRGIFFDRSEAERTTLHEALDRYFREVSSLKKHPHQEEQRIRRWQKHPLALRTLASLRSADFAAYRDSRRSQGRAENTIRLELALVGHLFEIVRKEWGMEGLANPLKNIKKPSGSAERDRRLKPGEYELIAVELARSENTWVLPLFDLAIETALRQGMLFELRWDWIDLNQRIISIPKAFRLAGNKGVPASLPLTSKATSVLRSLTRSVDDRVFPVTANALRCVWKRALRRLQLTDLRWHDLRHEASSRFFEKGLHPMEVASITGHKSLNMLRRYTHLHAADLVKKLN